MLYVLNIFIFFICALFWTSVYDAGVESLKYLIMALTAYGVFTALLKQFGAICMEIVGLVMLIAFVPHNISNITPYRNMARQFRENPVLILGPDASYAGTERTSQLIQRLYDQTRNIDGRWEQVKDLYRHNPSGRMPDGRTYGQTVEDEYNAIREDLHKQGLDGGRQ